MPSKITTSQPTFLTSNLSPGMLIAGRYRLERDLACGGISLFLAHDEVLQQRVAVKVPHSVTNLYAARFLREARAAAKLQHENIAGVLDCGQLPTGAPFAVLEFLEGRDLEQELQARGRLPIAEAVALALQALDGLAAAHDQGIVHRDIKPANLFLAKRQGDGVVVKILDFEIAEDDDSIVSALKGCKLGSPPYLSPEQVQRPKNAEARSDLWAMGIVLYELLTGALPFNGESIGEIVAAVVSKAPPLPRSLRPEIPTDLESVILSCLEKDPNARLPDARALAAALLPFAGSSSRR
jgi:eukaryotic-like serine/threonine-protein kinase